MAVVLRQNLVSRGKYNIKCPYSMKAESITVHNTWNDASAENEVKYMIGNNKKVSFHIAVDDKEAVQGILVAGLSTYVNQIVKQVNKAE